MTSLSSFISSNSLSSKRNTTLLLPMIFVLSTTLSECEYIYSFECWNTWLPGSRNQHVYTAFKTMDIIYTLNTGKIWSIQTALHHFMKLIPSPKGFGCLFIKSKWDCGKIILQQIFLPRLFFFQLWNEMSHKSSLMQKAFSATAMANYFKVIDSCHCSALRWSDFFLCANMHWEVCPFSFFSQ